MRFFEIKLECSYCGYKDATAMEIEPVDEKFRIKMYCPNCDSHGGGYDCINYTRLTQNEMLNTLNSYAKGFKFKIE